MDLHCQRQTKENSAPSIRICSRQTRVASQISSSVPTAGTSPHGVTQGGSEWQTWRIFDLVTRKKLPDVLTGLIHEYVLWMPGGKAFMYIRHTEPQNKSKRAELLRFPAIYMHRVGTKQSNDKLIYRRLDKPNWYIGPSVALNGKLAVLTNWTEEADKSIVLAKAFLKSGAAKERLIPVFPKGDAAYRYFTSRKADFTSSPTKTQTAGALFRCPPILPKSTWESQQKH